MSPRVAYWTASFRAEMEGIASEVACLRAAFPRSVIWGISTRDGVRLSWRSGFCFGPRMQLAFRGMTWLMQHAFDINHLFGSLGDWFHLRAVRRRPTVLTVALLGVPCERSLLEKVDCFAVEWPGAREQLEQCGVEKGRIRLIFPPVDLERFRPLPPRDGFRVLFASSPDKADWLKARGLDLILEAARLRPQIRFRLIWRPWGDSLARIQHWIEERAVGNVELAPGYVPEMAVEYEQAHVTVAPFVSIERCKPAPNSLLESLACGRPVILTAKVGLAELIQQQRAGVVCGETGESLAAALDEVQADWDRYSRQARLLAEQRFAVEEFVNRYARLYEELL